MTPYEMSAAILHYAGSCLLLTFAVMTLTLALAALFNLKERR